MLNIDTFELQMEIRSTEISRKLLDQIDRLESDISTVAIKRIRIWRNHNFESIAKIVSLLMSTLNFSIEWQYSGYDDTLQMNAETTDSFDLEIIWLDLTRFPLNEVEKKVWLENRISELVSKSSASFFIILTIGASLQVDLGIHFRLEDIVPAKDLTDSRMGSLFGTYISDVGQKRVSKWLSFTILPSLFGSYRKIIAVDMDDTLHKGILGEDGIDNIQVPNSFRNFQEALLLLKAQGILLILVTKNHHDDVMRLLSSDKYIIKSDDFVRIYAGWDLKPNYVRMALEEFKLHQSSLVFIDDNQGEIVRFSQYFPEAELIRAESDAGITKLRLDFTPGLFSVAKDTEGSRRQDDLKANSARDRFSETIETRIEYFLALQPRIEFLKSPNVDLERFSVQSLRTNQFNLNLAKFSVEKLKLSLLDDKNYLIQIRYADNFGESGIVGSVSATRSEHAIIVDQIYLSCRTLGRGIETEIMEELIEFLHTLHPECQFIRFNWSRSTRNEPALNWLKAFTSRNLLGDHGAIEIDFPKMTTNGLFEVIYN